MATKSIAWDSGGGYIRLTYTGSGNGTISVESDVNNGSARSKVITVETVGGAVTQSLTISQAACPVPVGTILTYSYTGSYQEVTLPAGQYKLQCWGAQGGSNAAASSYSITAKAGGKGGYSEGIITLSQKTTVRVYVGGQGSSSSGGYNGGGSTSGSSSYSTGTSGQAGYTYGTSRMGGGGGATDIRLSDGALLSRMIVAGGGAGGAMCYKAATTESTVTDYSSSSVAYNVGDYHALIVNKSYVAGRVYTVTGLPSGFTGYVKFTTEASWQQSGTGSVNYSASRSITAPSGYNYMHLYVYKSGGDIPSGFTVAIKHSSTSTSTSNDSQVGGVGGGTSGGGYSTTYQGKQGSAGSGGAFGTGANQTATNYRYCSGAGGGGWYGGGGGQKSDSSMTYCKYSGGGSGFVNIAANAQYRPSGYTGLELDSGETKDGANSFPNTSGTGNETGHSGNGYAKITRLA